MIIINSREFRDNQTQYFNFVDSGEQVIVQRGKKKSYSINPVNKDDLYFTPEILAKIERALGQSKMGEGVVCNTHEESMQFMESL